MPSAQLISLVDAVAPLFAGEAEVMRTYWTSPVRNADTDRLWLLRQSRKEVWDTPLGDQRGLYVGPVEDLLTDFPKIDTEIPREDILERMEGIYEEFSHYCAFADAYDSVRPAGEPRLSPPRLRDVPDWDENLAIRDRRAAIKTEQGSVGERACFFTEGGYCTLFSEGMALAGKGGVDDMIARACALVYEDEFGHMCKGIVGLDTDELSAAEWVLMTDLSVELAILRIHMRNGQFSYPLSTARIAAIVAGDIEPVVFDFEKAAAH
jgi:hypothetical protein